MRHTALLRMLVLALLSACTPGSGGGGGVGGGGGGDPTVGGHTGDPGVGDFISIDPGAPSTGTSSGGNCPGGIGVLYRRGGDPAPQRIDENRLIQLDLAHGLAQLDLSQAEPRITARLELPHSVGDLHLLGDRAIVVRRNARSGFDFGSPELSDEAELIVVDLSNSTRLTRLSTLALSAGARFSHAIVSEGRARLYVLTDGGFSDHCGARGQQPLGTNGMLTSYELVGDQLVERARLELPDVRTVGAAGQHMLAMRGDGLSLISLANPDGTLRESQTLPITQVRGVYAQADGALRIASEGAVTVVDVRGPVPAVRSECSFTAGNLTLRTVFSAHHTFFQSTGSVMGPSTVTSVAALADGSCQVRTWPGRGRTFAMLGDALVLDLERQPEGPGLIARLREEGGLAQLDEEVLRPADDREYSFRDEPALIAAPAGSAETGIFALQISATVPLAPSPYAYVSESEPALQLFSFSTTSISPRGLLSSAFAPLVAGRYPLAQSERGLARLDLSSLDAPRLAAAAVDLLPRYARLWKLGDHWLRLHQHPGLAYLPGSDETLFMPSGDARVELVDGSEHPGTGPAIGSFGVNPWASVVPVGELVVSVVSPQRVGPQRAEIQVFDLRDRRQPRLRAELSVADLWLNDQLSNNNNSAAPAKDCLDCTDFDLRTRAVALSSALVLRTISADGDNGLRVLDLSDPSAPKLSPPLAMPTSAKLRAVFAHDGEAYYAYSVAEPAMSGLARHYFGRVDLTDPAAPRTRDVANVPGELVAIAGEHYYTREHSMVGGAEHVILHRLSLREGHILVEASHDFGNRYPLAISLDAGGRVLVDLWPGPLADPYARSHMPLTVRLLEAATLRLVGEAPVSNDARRIAAEHGHALYRTGLRYVLMDLREPTRPRIQANVPSFGKTGLIVPDGFVLQASGGLVRLPIDFTTSP